ncbi:putative stoned B-like protein, partial [Dirofilaria immitis]
MAWKFHGSDDFDLNAGRNAFRSDASLDDWENADTETIMRRNSAIRSFTESVDSDFPPAPELPPSLNIDLHYSEEAMKRSETSETIIEKKPKPKPKLSLQEVVSGTHKYPMMVPGPGHIDEEQELHASLLHHDESDSDVEISSFERKQSSNTITKKEQQKGSDRDHAALRYGYSVSTLERPRPVTPTSWCAIENYIGGSLEAEDEPPPIAAKKQKIHVSIPNHNVSQTSRRRRRASMSWSDFYETMSTQLPSQARRSLSGSTTPLHDYDGDILEEDPRYRDVAPPKPVIHRRTSTDWESFMDKESEILKSTENNDINKTDITTNDGDTKLISSKMPLYDIQTISDDQKRFAVSTASNPSENAENSKQIFASHTDNISSSGLETALQIQISDRLENSEWNEKTMMEQKKSTTNVESKKSSTIDKKDDGIFYQQSAENQQYACSYNEPQTQGYGGIQNLNYDYDTTQYQNYEQQQQQKQGGSSVYQNYDQMSYVTAFQTYDQQSAVSNDYGQQPVIMRDYDQSITLSGYGISEYDQSEEYSYDQAIGYNAYSSSIVPSANNQNYMSQTVSESYSDINKKSSNDFGAQQYEQRNAENLPMDINDDGYRPPIIPKYIAPLFPTVISSEPNPFSWEAQENAAATTFAESIPEYVVQSVQPSSTKTYLETTNEIDSAEEIKQKPPLQRPASPSPSVERVIPPIRPPPPPPPPLPLSPNRKQSLHQRLCPSKLMKSESEEDAWTQFKKITERATISVKSTEEKLKELEKTTAAKDLKDESYLAQIGGSQACISEQAYRHAREKGSIAISVKNKKKMKNGKIKKIPEPELTLEQEDDMDRAAIELAKKMAATRIDMQDWKMPLEQHDDESVPYEKPNKLSDEISMIVPNESRKDDMIDKETSNILKESNITTTFNRESNKRAWTGFDDSQSTELPPSESGFFTNISAATVSLDKAFGDPMFASDGADASIKENLIDEDYDPFNVCPADDLVKEAKARVAAAIAA